MSYSKTLWVDYPSISTPVNAARLNNIENGVASADLAVVVQATTPPAGTRLWIQTGLGVGGLDWAIFFENGL